VKRIGSRTESTSRRRGAARARRLATLVALIGLAATTFPAPAAAQSTTIRPTCDGAEGVVLVTIDTGAQDTYRIFIDDVEIARGVQPGPTAIRIAPVPNGRREVRIDAESTGAIETRLITVQCPVIVVVNPTGGVATGGGGTAPNGPGSGTPWVAVVAGLVASLAAVALVRARFAT